MNTTCVLMMLLVVGSLFTLLTEGNVKPLGGVIIGAPLILFFNYVILGKLTLWHRQDSSSE